MSAKENIRAASYRRVSTPGQAKEGISLEDQQERISEFIAKRGWTLEGEYEDAGKSGYEDYRKRPAFSRMLADAVGGRFDAVVVVNGSRFSRNETDRQNVMARLKTLGVKVVRLDCPDLDLSQPINRFSDGVQGLHNQLAAEEARMKSKHALEYKLRHGERNLGQRLPYGLRWKTNHRELEHDPSTVRVWNLVKDLRRAGWSLPEIASGLNGDKAMPPALLERHQVTTPVRNPHGKNPRWHDSGIGRMFSDTRRVSGEFSFTFTPWNGEPQTYTVIFPPLMSQSESDEFAETAEKKLCWKPKEIGRGSMLSRLCRCQRCGGTLVVSGGGGDHNYYGCVNRADAHKGRIRCDLPYIRKERLENEVLHQLAEFTHDERAFRRAIERASADVRSRAETLDKLTEQERRAQVEFDGIETRMQRLLDAIEDGAITRDDAKARRQQIDRDKARLSRQLEDVQTQRAVLQRESGVVEQVEASRTRLAAIIGRWARMKELNGLEVQELLHSLLPKKAGCHILVGVTDKDTPGDANDPEPIGTLWVQVNGVLAFPVEAEPVLESAAVGRGKG